MSIQTAEKNKIVLHLTRVWLWTQLLGLPLALYNGFFDITEVKTVWYVVSTVLYLLGRGVCAIQFGASGQRRLTPGGICALAFCFVSLLGSIGSGFFPASFIGAQGRWQGTGMFWLYAAAWFSLQNVPLRQKDVLSPLAAGLSITAGLAVLNHLGVDPLRLEASLTSFDRGRYISTLGNIDFAGAYFSLTLPVMGWALLTGETPRRRALWGAVYALGLWAVMAVRSEAALLGLGVGLAVMPFALRDKSELERWGGLVSANVVWMTLYRLLAGQSGAYLSALTRLLLLPASVAGITVLGAGLFLLARNSPDAGRFRRRYSAALAAALGLCALALVLLNTVLSSVPLGALEDWLRFGDAWGTDRVRVWRHCLRLRRHFNVWEKLFGGGCGILSWMDARDRVFDDAILDTAHSEYLQILLNWGWLGLLSYLGWLGLSVREGLRRGGALALALLAGLAAYGAQALVNIAQAPGIMLFFTLLSAQRTIPERAR